MTRKQREQADRERKAAEYRKRHEAGLTDDEYKRDIAKLAEVKRHCEVAAARAAAEKEAEEAQEEERKMQMQKAQEDTSNSDSEEEAAKKKIKSKKNVDVPKLDKISTIKKMKPAQLKGALKKARGCDIQGNAKALTKRLLDFKAAR